MTNSEAARAMADLGAILFLFIVGIVALIFWAIRKARGKGYQLGIREKKR